LAYTLDYLGTVNMMQEDPAKAEPIFLRSLRIFEKAKGASSEEALDSVAKLAESYDERQLWAKSEPLYHRLVDAGRGDPSQQSVDINNLAVAIDAQGRQDEALSLYEKALSLRESSQGQDSPDLPEILNNEARVYYMKGDYPKGESLYLRSIAIDRQAKSPLLADDERRLAPLYRKEGRQAEADKLEADAQALEAAQAQDKMKTATKSKKAHHDPVAP
jgi:tetratricopeptide (TPR) repeat protein